MKVTYAVILSLGFLATVLSLPAKSNEKAISDEVVQEVPVQKHHPVTLEDLEKDTFGEQPIVDTAAFDFSFSNPFDGFLQGFESMLTRMRQQMTAILNSVPAFGVNGTEPDFSGGSFPVFDFGSDVDLGKGNTTSVTKIIDGHKVVINETEYKKEGENGASYFKVRVIDVKPDSGELTTERESESFTSAPRDTESLESKENEIPKNKENEAQPSHANAIEAFDEVDSIQKRYIQEPYYWYNTEPLYQFDNNFLEEPSQYKSYDLSRDTYVNDLLTQKGAPVNPDAEVFDVNNLNNALPPLEETVFRPLPSRFFQPTRNQFPQVFQPMRNERPPQFFNRFRTERPAQLFQPIRTEDRFRPIDLSNDIRVNQLTRNIPINPDAEVFDVNDNQERIQPYREVKRK